MFWWICTRKYCAFSLKQQFWGFWWCTAFLTPLIKNFLISRFCLKCCNYIFPGIWHFQWCWRHVIIDLGVSLASNILKVSRSGAPVNVRLSMLWWPIVVDGQIFHLQIYSNWWKMGQDGRYATSKRFFHRLFIMHSCGSSVSNVVKSLAGIMIWKHFPHYCPFVKGIHRWPVDTPHKRRVMSSFGVFFVIILNKLWKKQSSFWWFKAPCKAPMCWHRMNGP